MRRRILPVTILVAFCCILRVSAQHAVKKISKIKDAQKKAAPAVVNNQDVTVYLGASGLTGGNIRKGQFDTFSKQGLTLGSSEIGGSVNSFSFVYAERVLYEDSVGNSIVLTDYLTEPCDGPYLSRGILSSIYDRTKPGDTAYFDGIRVSLPSGIPAKGKSMKFVITR